MSTETKLQVMLDGQGQDGLDLPELARRIDAAHRACMGAATTTLRHALEVGCLLIEAKAQLRHGDWLSWLRANTPVTPRQSQRYMQLARHREAIEAKCDLMSHLSLTGALAELAAPPDDASDETLVEEFMHALMGFEPFEKRLERMSLEEVVAFLRSGDAQLAELNREHAFMRLLSIESRLGFAPGEFCGHVAALAEARAAELMGATIPIPVGQTG